MKMCSKCSTEKNDSEFHKRSDNKNKLRSWCKDCEKQYTQQNKIQIKQRSQQWNKNNQEYCINKKKQYYQNHKESIKAQAKQYYETHKTQSKQWNKQYISNKRKNDPFFKLKSNIRSLISQYMRNYGYSKTSRTYELLGCSYEELMTHLGHKPEGDMELDHICPCAQARNQDEFIKLQHYSNFRWLTSEENGPRGKSNHKTPEGEEMCKKLLGRDWIL